MIKHRVRCNDCGLVYFLEDAEWCIHYKTLRIGTKVCPQCHNCICHGETADQIQARFTSNIAKGKFVKTKNSLTEKFGWDYQCKTIEAIKVD